MADGYTDWIDASEVVSGVHRTSDIFVLAQPPTVEVTAFLDQGLPELARVTAGTSVLAQVQVHVFRSATDARPILELNLYSARITSLIEGAPAGGGPA